MWPIIAAVALWLVEGSYVPQIYRLFRRKSAESISVLFPSMNMMGRIMLSAYSIHMNTAVLALGFIAGVIVRLVFLCQVIYYRIRSKRQGTGLMKDEPTGLNSESHFEERLRDEVAHALRQGHNLTLVLCKVDRFDEVIDAHGAPGRDAILRELGHLIGPSLRAGDFAARLGNLLVVLLREIEIAKANVVADRIRKQIAGCLVKWSGNELRVTASIGVAALQRNDNPKRFREHAIELAETAAASGGDRIATDEQPVLSKRNTPATGTRTVSDATTPEIATPVPTVASSRPRSP